MGAAEYMRWGEYYRCEPWGATRDNMHAGIIAAALTNPHRRRGTRALTHDDFMLRDSRTQHADQRRKFREYLRSMAVKK
jgi:hypothetical protein